MWRCRAGVLTPSSRFFRGGRLRPSIAVLPTAGRNRGAWSMRDSLAGSGVLVLDARL
jgi:hypothetical protein